MPPGGTISSVEAQIADIAAGQHGVITLLQLLAAGLSRKQIAHRVRTGRLHRLHQGVYAVGYAPVAYEGKATAAVLACRPAALGLLHAASLFEVSRFRRPALIDVVVPKQRRGRDGVRIHHRANLRRGDLTTVDRIPVTRPARMLVDLNDALTAHQLANVIHRCAYRGLFSAAATRDVMARTRRTKTIERALALHASGSAGTRSHNEDRSISCGRTAGCSWRSTASTMGGRRRNATTRAATRSCAPRDCTSSGSTTQAWTGSLARARDSRCRSWSRSSAESAARTSPSSDSMAASARPSASRPASLDPVELLEVVEHQDAVVGVHVRRDAQLLLGEVAVAQVRERDVGLELHPQHLVGRLLVGELRQPDQRHDRAGNM
jgi:hypothetical protein